MTICAKCSTAISELILPPSKPPLQNTASVNVVLTKLDEFLLTQCWICLKISRWLTSEKPAIMDLWMKTSITLQYAVNRRMGIGRAKDGESSAAIFPPLFIDISVVDDTIDQIPLEVEIAFAAKIGRVRTLFDSNAGWLNN
jgi:hypothetical protein